MAPAHCQLWGVLNITPDSFSDGGRFLESQAALRHAEQMIAEGADCIDVGGASSRPRGSVYGGGAAEVSPQEEARRVGPVIEALRTRFDVPISVDTTRPEVALCALEAGATIVNDVSGGADQGLLDVVARSSAELVLMHTRGDGSVTRDNTRYTDVVADVGNELAAAVARAMEVGVERGRIWLDPGIGFAKTAEQSSALLGATAQLANLGHRLLVGPSRKAFIAAAAPNADGSSPGPLEREHGTAAAVAAAVLGGAHAVRVHAVAPMRQAVRVAEAMRPSFGAST